MDVQMQSVTCHITCIPDDLLCNYIVPDSRVLLMTRTCRRIRSVLENGRCAVHIKVKKKVETDAQLATTFVTGMNNIQFHYRIRHFECCAWMHRLQLKFSDCEELTLMHLRTLKMNGNQLTELHMLSLLYMLTFSSDMRSFEFTQQSLKCRHVPWLGHCISRFTRLETLNLDKNYFVFDSLGLLLDVVQTSVLSTLNLSTNSCEDDCKMIKLCRVIQMNYKTLQVLNLSFMRLSNGAFDLLIHAMSTCKFLHSLDLSRNHLQYGCLMDVLNATSACHMRSFDWSGNRLCSAGTYMLANHLMHSNIWKETLREMKLGTCEVYDGLQLLCDAFMQCTALTTLDISNNAVYATEVANILKNTSITSLNINNNYISEYGMQLILQRSMRSTTLKDLSVCGNHMSMHTLRQFRLMKKKKKMTLFIPRTPCPCGICTQIDTSFILNI